ncbi:MAG: YitT family protein [Anaeroplasmataceae bacterium]|nr:YitT family protein [Anaeroplasmataceae bacterium]
MKKERLYEDIFRVGIVIFTSTLYSLSILWFLEPANLIAIGGTAIAQILNRAFSHANINIPIGVFTLLLNIPICIYGMKRVSIRFVMYSILSILIQSFLMMGWDWIKVDFGINPNDKFFLGVIGGLLGGSAIGIALRYGTSTGGMDIIGQALALRKNVSIGIFSAIVNILLAIIAGGIIEKSWDITFYTFIFIIICNLVVDKIHTAYNYLRVDVISENSEEVAQALLEGIQRGCTISTVKGAYTHKEKYDIFMIISSYELQKATEIIRNTDPNAFMTVTPIKRIFGKFFRHTIT